MATCLEPGRAAWRGPVNARGALRGDSTGRPRRAPRPAGTPGTSGERSRSRGARLVNRARADEDGRDAAAAAARLAPLEASTAAGSELERILKTDPVAFERALSDQLRAMASDVFHPSFPGGRSGSLRDRVGGSFGAQPSSLQPGHSCDLREKPGAGDGFPSTEYLQLEGVISSKAASSGAAEGGAEGGADASMSRLDKSSKGAKNGHPKEPCEDEHNPSSRPNADKAERIILSELADAVAFGARVDRANELRDAMYLSVVARHCALGVPLVPEVEAFHGSRGSSRGSALFGGSVSGRGVGGGGGRRTGAHDRKVSRLVRECLPTGADELIERHIDRIISDVEAFGLSDGALAGAYRKSALFGYFLRCAATRLALEHSFQATPTRDESRGDDEEHARHLREDGYELVSNISSLPAYPSSIGDWIAEDGDDVDDEQRVDPAVSEARARRRREAEATFRAQATRAKAEATSRTARSDITESTSPRTAGSDEFDADSSPEAELERARERRRERQWRRALGGAYPDRPLAAFPSSIGDWVASSSSADDDAEYDEPFYEKPIFDAVEDTDAAPNLRAFVDAMEPTLRAQLATIGQADVAAVLDSHVAALFYGDVEAAPRDVRGATAGGDGVEAEVVSFDFAGLAGLSKALMPLDGLRYMVVEACAFGASLWSAERRCERYDLTRRSVDGAKDQSESRR